MSYSDTVVVEHAPTAPSPAHRDPIVLSADDVRAAHRLADNPRLSDGQLRSYGDDLAAMGHARAAATYAEALAIRTRRAPVSTRPDCGICEEFAAWHVYCCAEDGGELLACNDCANHGDPDDSRAIEWVQSTAIHPSSKVRVDALDDEDVAQVAA